ncbi:ACP S-malonyltransferase [Rarobacter incanus]|uniref:ACP S-malonyltransferase n=1 Tax=Rarobacter incanus TaxID=153494 RepID=UPI001150CDB3|nr:ACP S-malonyltransferase [Rarobacter incanus]
MLALLSPGQGSQTPGMLTPWLEIPGIAELVDQFSDAAQIDLRAHGTSSDADTIKDTAIAQPLIVASSLIAAHVLSSRGVTPASIGATGGHSVGEFAAAALAGVFTAASAVALVGKRATAMARAAAAAPSGMSAVLGGDREAVLARLRELGLTPANMNGGGQIVAAGSLTALAELVANPPAKARVIPLAVAGAFHTSYMEQARDEFRAAAADWPVAPPRVPLLSNADGAVLHADTTGAQVLERLINQVASPVRWDLCQDALLATGVSGIVELLPGGVLTGLARRSLKGVPAVAIKSPDDIDKAVSLINEVASAEIGEAQ